MNENRCIFPNRMRRCKVTIRQVGILAVCVCGLIQLRNPKRASETYTIKDKLLDELASGPPWETLETSSGISDSTIQWKTKNELGIESPRRKRISLSPRLRHVRKRQHLQHLQPRESFSNLGEGVSIPDHLQDYDRSNPGIILSGIKRRKRQQRQRQQQRQQQQQRDSVVRRKQLTHRPNDSQNSIHNITLSPNDSIYNPHSWDSAPIVLEEFKLVFFTIPKVGCTVWKQLFRRMMGCPDWRVHDPLLGLPHDPHRNNLTYLYDFSPEDALYIMTSNSWTRAIFLRDPMDRILSAYLDKGIPQNETNHEMPFPSSNSYIVRHCCPRRKRCDSPVQNSFENFLHLIPHCPDPHWTSQSKRMGTHFWPFVNFVGHLETAPQDAQRLLQHIGAWDTYGKSGWGQSQNDAIFVSTDMVQHKANANLKHQQYFTNETIKLFQALYEDDLNNPLLQYTSNGSLHS